jgi:endonuclease/exonuclease/phosphatase family metal-dependent hydrolase
MQNAVNANASMCFRAAIAISCALVSALAAVEVRVATFNIGAHFNESFFDYSLGDPGTPDHESVREILARIDADVVALQEIHSVDLQGSPTDLQALASSLGYPHLSVPPVSGVFDTSLRVVILSRHPFLQSGSISPPSGAKDMTRRHAVVKVDVPGTANDLLLVTAHLKSGTVEADRFQRAVEMKRLTQHLSAAGITDDDNFVVLGDFNPSGQNRTFTTQPAQDLPGSFVLGPDIAYPVVYSTDMLSYFTTPSAVRLDARQLNGSRSTFGTTFSNGPVLDLILVSPAIAARPFAAEVYNSALDTSNSSGLPKAGDPLSAGTSATASDHYAVFADLEMDSDLPDLQLVMSAPSVPESAPAGTVMARVTLPAARATPVTVSVASDQPSVAAPVDSALVIPAGSLTGEVAIATARNFIADGPRVASLTASAPGYDPAGAVLGVADADGPYGLRHPGDTLVEDFTGFGGLHDPAPWTTGGGQPWLGVDNGSSSQPGWRVYGSGPGFLTGGAPVVMETQVENRSSVPLTALQVALDAGQWLARTNGAADRLEVELVPSGGTAVPLPALTFTASPPPGGGNTRLADVAGGLWIPPGSSFLLRVSFIPGTAAAPSPANVFINEFHYDNSGEDTGEFVEIVVGPGYDGALADIDVVFYNGSNSSAAKVYRTLNLASDFTPGATVAGYRFFSVTLPKDGIQNGDNDGFAIVDKAAPGVLQLISYEGVFTAADGPAAGLVSTDIGVSQSTAQPAGFSGLGLTGSGSVPGDFTWVKFSPSTAHSPGQPNDGQALVLPTAPPQGLGFDNLSLSFLTDNDLDGDPDITDPDDDNDGQTDAHEAAFGSDPLDGSSRFAPVVTGVPGSLSLVFPGAPGITYHVETSATLEDDWVAVASRVGSGAVISVPLPQSGPAAFFRVRAALPP